jgi:hypothetical protein
VQEIIPVSKGDWETKEKCTFRRSEWAHKYNAIYLTKSRFLNPFKFQNLRLRVATPEPELTTRQVPSLQDKLFFNGDQCNRSLYLWLQGSSTSTKNLDYQVPTLSLEYLIPKSIYLDIHSLFTTVYTLGTKIYFFLCTLKTFDYYNGSVVVINAD